MIRTDNELRFWSLLGKTLPGGLDESWAYIGCVSMEDRSISSILEARKLVQVSDLMVIRIADDPGSRYYSEAERKTDVNQAKLIAAGVRADDFSFYKLLDPFGLMSTLIDTFLQNCVAQNLIFDITSMPKKVFFYLVKKLLRDGHRFTNILVTYSEPDTYSDEPLAENPLRWNTLPGFDAPRRAPENRRVVIGIGYEPLGLPDLVVQGEFQGAETHLLFPFPAPPDRIKRNWEFARELFPNPAPDLVFNHVDGVNLPEAFDLLTRIGDAGQTQLTLAPYGPKPISLAMALYASKHCSGSSSTGVYYTQPTGYNPNYSTGTKLKSGHLAINCYAIKRFGQLLY